MYNKKTLTFTFHHYWGAFVLDPLIWLDNGYKSGHVIIQDKSHIPWNKNHIPPPRKPRRFSRQSYRSLTGKHQRHSERITCRRPLQWMWFLNVWDNVPVDLKYVCQQYFTYYMCFLGFIRYNKTFIAWNTGNMKILPSGNMIL